MATTTLNQGRQGTCAVYAVVPAVETIVRRKYNIAVDTVRTIHCLADRAGAYDGARVTDIIDLLGRLDNVNTLDDDLLRLEITHSGVVSDFDALYSRAQTYPGAVNAVVSVQTRAQGHGRHAVVAEGATELQDGTRTVQCQNSWGGVKPLFDVVSAGGLRDADDPRVPYLQHVLITDVRITRMTRRYDGNRVVLPLPTPLERHTSAGPHPLLQARAEAQARTEESREEARQVHQQHERQLALVQQQL